jgi:hypothetical protein
MVGMLVPIKAAFPDWEFAVISCVDNTDGTSTVITQQKVGKMKADLAAVGPFPPISLASTPYRCKGTACALPYVFTP